MSVCLVLIAMFSSTDLLLFVLLTFLCWTYQMYLVQQMTWKLLCLHQCIVLFFFISGLHFAKHFIPILWILIQWVGQFSLFCPSIWAEFWHIIVQGCWIDWFLADFVLKAKFQSQSWLWASEKSVHEGHGRSTVSPEPAHQNTQKVRGGCKRGRLLPVSISCVIVVTFHFLSLMEDT